jgi:hypothetical protein
MHKLSLRLDPPTSGLQTDDERANRRLATECRHLSGQIVELVEDITPKDPKSKRSTVRSALKSVWNEKNKQELEKRLDKCRS